MSDDSNIMDFAAARFEKTTDARDTSPNDALAAARKWVEQCDAAGEPVEHIIILTGHTAVDGGSSTRYFQAGKYEYHSQIGLCTEGGLMIRDNG